MFQSLVWLILFASVSGYCMVNTFLQVFQGLVGSTYADYLVGHLANHLAGYFGVQLVCQDTSSDTIDSINTIYQKLSIILIFIFVF